MRAVVTTPAGPAPVAIDEVEPVTPGSHESLVRVRAISINRGELALIASRPAGWRPGQDVAGVIERAAADGSGPAAGTRVVGMVEGAGWAEQVAVPSDRLAVLADGVAFAVAATLPIAGITALRTLRLGPDLLGRRVLVTGGSGAVGRFQVELATIQGAQVTAVAGTEYADSLRSLGAAAVVPDTGALDGLFDLVTESIGGASLAAAIGHSRPGSTIVVFGASSGDPTPISLYDFIGHEGVAVRVFMSYASGEPFGPDLQLLADLTAADRLHPHLDRTCPWIEITTVLAALRDRRVHGKAVLTLGPAEGVSRGRR